mmetsp:Transcript_103749/g.206234  ORF Transcript_103749/g.206234 Transcript_103749/m.206234 type:complete len:264 (+) Transcript_103749:108-899(+)
MWQTVDRKRRSGCWAPAAQRVAGQQQASTSDSSGTSNRHRCTIDSRRHFGSLSASSLAFATFWAHWLIADQCSVNFLPCKLQQHQQQRQRHFPSEEKRRNFLLAAAAPSLVAEGEASAIDTRSAEEVRRALEVALREDLWFVSGRVRKEFFSQKFRFRDPDVSLEGIDNYGRGVASLFDQAKTRAEVLDVTLVNDQEIRVRWRLAAAVGLPPTLPIKLATAELEPYVVTSKLRLDGAGLIEAQEDEFDRPTSELLWTAKITLR